MYQSLRQIKIARSVISPPGDTLLETIEHKKMSQNLLAQQMGKPLQAIQGIISGKSAITPETAKLLERVLGIGADFWMKREQDYRLELEKIDEAERMFQRKIPLNAKATASGHRPTIHPAP